MYLCLRSPAATFTIALAGTVILGDLTEERRRYHLDTARRFAAELAYGKATIVAPSTMSTSHSRWLAATTATVTLGNPNGALALTLRWVPLRGGHAGAPKVSVETDDAPAQLPPPPAPTIG